MAEHSGADRGILVAALGLVAVGVLMVYSATAVMGMKGRGGDFAFVIRHVQAVIVGLMAMTVLTYLDYRWLRRAALPMLIFSFALMLLVFWPGLGVSANGARRWIRLWPSTFQPSELAKLAFVIFLADYMSRPLGVHAQRKMNLAHALRRKMEHPLTGFAVPVSVMILFQVVLICQPDFGALMSFALIGFGMLFVGGVRLRYFLALSPVFAVALYKLVQAPYRMRRLTSFVNPWKDEQGAGYQLIQSLVSFGNGGLTGVGLGEGRQKLFFLPEPHTDFIFSTIGEELGLWGAMLVITLFLVFFLRGLRLASRAEESFGRYLALGLTFMVVLQALINFGVTTGLLPTKGLPLPFVSYGGSSLLVSLSAAGILLSISRGLPRTGLFPAAGREVSGSPVRSIRGGRSRGPCAW